MQQYFGHNLESNWRRSIGINEMNLNNYTASPIQLNGPTLFGPNIALNTWLSTLIQAGQVKRVLKAAETENVLVPNFVQLFVEPRHGLSHPLAQILIGHFYGLFF